MTAASNSFMQGLSIASYLATKLRNEGTCLKSVIRAVSHLSTLQEVGCFQFRRLRTQKWVSISQYFSDCYPGSILYIYIYLYMCVVANIIYICICVYIFPGVTCNWEEARRSNRSNWGGRTSFNSEHLLSCYISEGWYEILWVVFWFFPIQVISCSPKQLKSVSPLKTCGKPLNSGNFLRLFQNLAFILLAVYITKLLQ